MTRAQNPSNSFYDGWPEEILFSIGASHTTNVYEAQTLPVAEFIERKKAHRVGGKYGPAWSPFQFKGNLRKGENAVSASVIVLDIDNGTSLRRILLQLGLAGYAAVVVTSYNHMTMETTFSEETWRKWQEAHPRAAEEEFLHTRDKKFVEAVWRGSTMKRGEDGELLTNGEGKITIKHGLCPKHRIIIPLRERLLLADFGDLRERGRAWAGLCDVLAAELRVVSDKDAKLLTQVFFDPRCPESREHLAHVEIVKGEPFDWRAALPKAQLVAGRDKRCPDPPPHQQSSPLTQVFTDPRYDKSEVVTSALEAMGNSGIGRTEWIKISAGIHVEFGGSPEGEEIFDWWTSLREDGNVKPEKDATSWAAFRDSRPDGSSGKTIRKCAYKVGWSPDAAGFPDYEWGDGWAESQIVFEDEREIRDNIIAMNAEFAVVKNKGSVRILHECKDENGVDAFDLMKQEDFRLLTKGRGLVKAVNASGRPTKGIPIAEYWLGSPQRREYSGLIFRPGEAARRGEESGRPKFLNLWTRWGVEPSPHGSCRLFKEHLLDDVCRGSKGLFDYALDWMAHIFQRPREKPGVALVLLGKKGAGKSIIGDTLGALVGRSHYFITSKPEQLLGKHNAQLVRAVVIQAEEAFFVHDPKMHGPLKDFITGKTRTIEPKFVDAYLVDACDRLIMTSNKDAVVPADRGERRFTVFNVGDAHVKDTAYFGAMIEELESGGYERLLYELLRRDLHGFDCRTAYETEALAEQKLLSLDKTEQWARDELTSGELWENSGSAPCFKVSKRILRKRYLDFVQEMRVGHPLGEARLGEWLVGNLGFKSKRLRSEGRLEQCYVIPPLWEARERFIARFELPPTIFDEAGDEKPQKRREVFRVKADVQG